MKKLLTVFSIMILQIAGTFSSSAALNVVATTPDLGAIGKAIGGSDVEITVLAKATEDPHFVDARPSFIVKLNRADALIEGGAELEIGWLPALVEQSRNSKLQIGSINRIRTSEGISMLDVPSTLDRSRGDVHAMGNPHFTTDPLAVKTIATHIASSFCEIDAKHCEDYKKNLESFDDELTVKLEEWQKKLAPYKGQDLVAYHNSWPYFAQRFGLKSEIFLEPKPGIPPTPAHLARVIQQITAQNARVILVPPYVSPKTAEVVSERTHSTVVEAATCPEGRNGEPGDYFEWMDGLVTQIVNAFQAKF